MMTAIRVTKLQKVEVPAEYQKEEGCVAFQLVKFEYNFYGNLQSAIIDTKIMADGSQIVIDGNGFIKAGYEI